MQKLCQISFFAILPLGCELKLKKSQTDMCFQNILDYLQEIFFTLRCNSFIILKWNNFLAKSKYQQFILRYSLQFYQVFSIPELKGCNLFVENINIIYCRLVLTLELQLSHLPVIPYLETLSKNFVPHNQIFDARAIMMQCNGICKRIFLC